MNTCQTSIKTAVAHILGLSGKHGITRFGSQRTDQGWEVKRTNIDVPKPYRRSTTETIINPIGQNILLIYPRFGIDFLQPPRFPNSKASETVKLDYS